MYEELLEEQDSRYSIRIDEEAARRCVEQAERGLREGDFGAGTSTVIAEIEGYLIGVSACNRLFVKLPGKGRRWVTRKGSGRTGASWSPVFKASNGHAVWLDRKSGTDGLPQAVVDKLDAILTKKEEVERRMAEDAAAEPPADLFEDETESGGGAVDELLGYVNLIQ